MDHPMIVCTSISEAQAVPGVIHIHFVSDTEWNAYEDGDTLPSTEPTLAEKQAQVWESIKVERDTRKLQGGYQAAGKWFHSDVVSRTQQLGLVIMGAGIPQGTQWKTMDGSFVPMTQYLAQQIFAGAAQQDMQTFAVAEKHRIAMLQAADPLEYDFSGGWPPTFTG
jgi:hypothetical protein